mmetsp:Transcript_31169/g.66363  ORF Transcript_31169/g.66363 Transcript_31169/m.66363 type:complete len:236 (+) Transcript_31169:103-810(+)
MVPLYGTAHNSNQQSHKTPTSTRRRSRPCKRPTAGRPAPRPPSPSQTSCRTSPRRRPPVCRTSPVSPSSSAPAHPRTRRTPRFRLSPPLPTAGSGSGTSSAGRRRRPRDVPQPHPARRVRLSSRSAVVVPPEGNRHPFPAARTTGRRRRNGRGCRPWGGRRGRRSPSTPWRGGTPPQRPRCRLLLLRGGPRCRNPLPRTDHRARLRSSSFLPPPIPNWRARSRALVQGRPSPCSP